MLVLSSPEMPLANRIREARGQHMALTQRELAIALGTDAVSISRWERGIVEPRPRFIREMSKLSGLPISWFFNENGDEEEAA